MNMTTAITLVDENVRIIKVVYHGKTLPEDDIGWSFKTTDQSIKVDDRVVVPTPTNIRDGVGYTVCKVVEVDCEIDLESDIKYRWIVQRVDFTEYQTTIDLERRVVEIIQKSQRRRRRAELARDLIDASVRAEIEVIISEDETASDNKSDTI